jgi:two-component system response regulator AtoC
LREHGGHRRKVAQIMGISERTLYRKLKRYGLR